MSIDWRHILSFGGRFFFSQRQLFSYVFPYNNLQRFECYNSSLQIFLSGGPSYIGYDISLAQDIKLTSKEFKLASGVEYFRMPPTFMAFVCDKSTLARCGLSVQNTVIEPGWRGFLTLELFNQSDQHIDLKKNQPIAQIVFMRRSWIFGRKYTGKYQDQPSEPTSSK